VDVRIGITQTAKEIDLELDPALRREDVFAEIEKALADSTSVLWLTDKRGRRVGVPSAKVAYIEIGADEDRRVGFGTR
jgi:hypothetical protein